MHGTVGCSRVSELANLQLCDLLWGHDGAFIAELAAALAIRICKRKQDTGRYWLYVRNLVGLLVDLIRAHVAELGLRMDDQCTKSEKAGARVHTATQCFPGCGEGETRLRCGGSGSR